MEPYGVTVHRKGCTDPECMFLNYTFICQAAAKTQQGQHDSGVSYRQVRDMSRRCADQGLLHPQALLFYEPNSALSDSETEDESEMHHPTCSASSGGGANTCTVPACVDTATSAAADAGPAAAAQQGQGPGHTAAAPDFADPPCPQAPPVAAAVFGSAASEHKPRSPKRMRS